MGKVVMPKNSALPEEILAALEIYYNENDWLNNSDFINRLKAIIGDGQYHSSYTKKVQMTSYFGFTEWQDFSKNTSARRITESGKRFYVAWKNNNNDKMFEELMYSLENTIFGRNNCGCSESNSDIEIPSLFIRTVLKLGYLTYSEFAFLLWKMEDCGYNYSDAVDELVKTRIDGNFVVNDEIRRYTDAKPIMMLARWGFLSEDGRISGNIKIVITPRVLEKYRNRLESLPIYNIDKFSSNQVLVSNDNKVVYATGLDNKKHRNRIIFGAPGTGKSFSLESEKNDLLANGGMFERVTFHPDYTYSNFVGCYKPVMEKENHFHCNNKDISEVINILSDKSLSAQEKYDLLYDRFNDEGLTRLPILIGLYSDDSFKTRKKDGSDAVGDNSVERNHGKAIRPYVNLLGDKINVKNEIAYKFVPGPFIRVYVEALKSAMKGEQKPFLLIIEEINRANVASVFGDIFQLLDRKNNISEYPIQTSEDLRNYLADELGGKPEGFKEIRLPDNMFIWATMNSADQGVFPMDTAFRRRWHFTYIDIDKNEDSLPSITYTFGSGENSQQMTWNQLRKAINKKLTDLKINEDKLLGPYFISKSVLECEDDGKTFIETFKDKVLMYLFEDAAKQKRNQVFNNDFSRYSELCNNFDSIGIDIFNGLEID